MSTYLPSPEVARQIAQWVHRVEHLHARQGRGRWTEPEMLHICWGVDEVPTFARELVAAGEPGSRWCPQLDESLVARSYAEYRAEQAEGH